jgi:hypothetical protein
LLKTACCMILTIALEMAPGVFMDTGLETIRSSGRIHQFYQFFVINYL